MEEKLQISLLGSPGIILGERPVTDFVSNKARALVYYLAATGVAHTRDALAGLLWSDVPDSAARKNLRDVLSNLRKLMGPYLSITRRTVSLNADAPCQVDSQHLSVALKAMQESAPPHPPELLKSLAQAADLYKGEFLAGFYVSDAPLFEEWFLLQREQLDRDVQEALGILAKNYGTRAEYDAAISYGRRWLALDQLQESAHRLLIELYARSGDRAAALRQYETCVRVLEDELGVEPSEQTNDLVERIRSGELLPALLASQIEKVRPAPGLSPYKGLHYFDVSDADLFFGREALTAKLVGRLRRNQFLAVVGASGSGKSSLVRAGLIPTLQRAETLADGTHPPPGCKHWPIHVLTPTAHPLEALALNLTQKTESVTAAAALMDDLAREPRSLHLYVRRLLAPTPTLPLEKEGSLGVGVRLLLVVDQLEELFTLCRDPDERQAFVDALLTATTPETAGPTLVVVTLRADFYHHCAQFKDLRGALERNQIYIGSMTPEESRRAILEPAQQNDWDFEPGLVDLMLRDAGEEPGALPLLSHALLETWRRRRGRTLTLGGYQEAGGVHGAIAQSAETVYQRLDPEQQVMTRRIFVRLTELGEGTQDTRRRVSRSELVPHTEEATVLEGVLNTLAEVRLITAEKETIEVAHEALIREWPTLRRWLEQDREGLRVHRHLTEAALEWERMERDPGELYRGARLAQALEWAQDHTAELNPLEQTFLGTSEELVRQKEVEREAQRQRELEAAQKLAQTEKRRAEEQTLAAGRLRRRAFYLIGALLVAVALAITAGAFGREAQQQRDIAERRAREADARGLAAAAVAELEVDPERGLLLAIEAVNRTYLVDGSTQKEALEALHQAVQSVRSLLIIPLPSPEISFTRFGPDGTRLMMDGFSYQESAWTTWGYDLARGEAIDKLVVAPIPIEDARYWFSIVKQGRLPAEAYVDYLAYDPVRELVAALFWGKTTKVWDLYSGQTIDQFRPGDRGYDCAAAFSPDGVMLATGDIDGITRILDLDQGEVVLTLPAPPMPVGGLAFSPDGLLAAASFDGSARIWEVSSLFDPADARLNPGRVISQSLLTLDCAGVQQTAIAFSQDGRLLATGGGDGMVRVWDMPGSLSTGQGQELISLEGHSGGIRDLAFNRDGSRLGTVSDDKSARVWDTSFGGPGEGPVFDNRPSGFPLIASLDLSADGRRLAVANSDPTPKIWDAESGELLLTLSGHQDRVDQIVFSPDGRMVVTSSNDGTIRGWDGSSGSELFSLADQSCNSGMMDLCLVAFSPDGALLSIAEFLGPVNIYETESLVSTSGEQVSDRYGTLVNDVFFFDMDFSHDGKRIALAGSDSMIWIWDIRDLDLGKGSQALNLRGHVNPVYGVSYSPDGSIIASAGDDETARIWDAESGSCLFTLAGHTQAVFKIAFNPDGTRVATASLDGTAKVWDASTGEELFTLYGHQGMVQDLVFSPDGRQLFTASDDGTVRSYLLDIDELIALAKSRVDRSLTAEECQTYLHLDECPSLIAD